MQGATTGGLLLLFPKARSDITDIQYFLFINLLNSTRQNYFLPATHDRRLNLSGLRQVKFFYQLVQ